MRREEEAAPLVLLHPVAQDRECWQFMGLPEPFDAHLFPNHGGRPRQAISLGAMADEVAGGMQAPADVVGVAMGAMVALHLMLRHPRSVRSAVLACGHASVHRDALLRRADETERRGTPAMLEETLERWFTQKALQDGIPGVAYARERLLRMEAAALADLWRAMAEHDVSDRLGAIEAPVTLIAGLRDRAVPVSEVEAMHARLARSRLQRLHAPHMIHLEEPQLLRAAIDEHRTWTTQQN